MSDSTVTNHSEIGYLYQIESPSGKLYIGQSVQPKLRFHRYSRLLCKAQKKLYCSILSHGWDSHKVKILCTLPSSQLNYAEKYLISYYKSNESGLNITDGGQFKMNKEMIQRMAKTKTGMPSPLKGRKYPPEFGLKQSILKKGKVGKRNFNRMKRVFMYDKEMNFIREYESCLSTEKDGFSNSRVSCVCLGKRKTHGGFIFKYEKL